jgi:hypothetical protein
MPFDDEPRQATRRSPQPSGAETGNKDLQQSSKKGKHFNLLEKASRRVRGSPIRMALKVPKSSLPRLPVRCSD